MRFSGVRLPRRSRGLNRTFCSEKIANQARRPYPLRRLASAPRQTFKGFLSMISRLGLIVAVVLTTVVTVGTTWAALQTRREGAAPYTPTKLEWLALECSARLGKGPQGTAMQTLILPDHTTDSILIVVDYERATTDRQVLNSWVELARNQIKVSAKGHGWDGWVNVKENLNGH